MYLPLLLSQSLKNSKVLSLPPKYKVFSKSSLEDTWRRILHQKIERTLLESLQSSKCNSFSVFRSLSLRWLLRLLLVEVQVNITFQSSNADYQFCRSISNFYSYDTVNNQVHNEARAISNGGLDLPGTSLVTVNNVVVASTLASTFGDSSAAASSLSDNFPPVSPGHTNVHSSTYESTTVVLSTITVTPQQSVDVTPVTQTSTSPSAVDSQGYVTEMK